MKRIFLIRHGESEGNIGLTKKDGNYKPDPIIELTEKGIEQAKDAGRHLKTYIDENHIDLNNSALWVSPYIRTRQTAKYINDILNINTRYEDPRIVEQDFGNFDSIDMCKWEETDKASYVTNQARYYNPTARFFAKTSNGEAPSDVYNRVSTFIETIFRDDFENLFIVTHGITMRVFLIRWFHYPVEWFYEEPNPNNCCVRLIEKEDDKYIDRGYIFKEENNKEE